MASESSFFDLASNYNHDYTPAEKPAPKPKKETLGASFVRGVKDLAPSFGSGAGQFVNQVGTMLGGSDSTIAELGANAEQHWNEAKSPELQAKERGLSEMMADKNKSAWDVVGNVLSNPSLASSMVAGSAPAMALGMGAGGIVAKGMVRAGVMVGADGAVTSLGARTAAGVGEGLAIAPDVYQATQGNREAGAAGLALGIITNLITPGNAGAAMARKVTTKGVGDVVENTLTKNAATRLTTAAASEGAQEYVQEGAQALVEQAGKGEQFDLDAASKRAALGGTIGMITGAALHPVAGEGAPTQLADGTLTEHGLGQLQTRLADINAALESAPNNPVLMAEAAATSARIAAGTAPITDREPLNLQLAAAEAQLVAARNPGNREALDVADHATAEAAIAVAGPEGLANAADIAVRAADEAIHAAPDLDTALQAFGAREQASAVLRTTATAIQNTNQGVDEALNAPEVSSTFDESTAEVVTPEQELKLEQQRLRTEHQQIKNNTANVRLQAEIAKARGEVSPVTPSPEVSGIEVSDASQQFKTRDDVFAAFDSQIRSLETQATDPDRTPIQREVAVLKMKQVEATRNRMAEGLPSTPPVQADDGMLRGDQVREFMARTPVQDAAAEMLREGLLPAVVKNQEGLSNTELERVYHRIDVPVSMRRHAFELYIERNDRPQGADLPMNRAQFDAREDAFIRGAEAYAGGGGAVNPQVMRNLISNLGSISLDSLRGIANEPGNPAMGVARAALAFRTQRHMGNIDEASGSRQAVRGSSAQGQGQVDLSYAGAPAAETQASTQRANRNTAIADELRQAAAEVDAEERGTRHVSANFRERARAALADGTLEKLGNFWKTVMAGRGQRVLNVNTSDLAGRADSMRNIEQADLNTLARRYNATLNERAHQWAAEHNQEVGVLRDPVISILRQGAQVTIRVRPLGRNGSNPYATTMSGAVGSASISLMDGHMTTTGLQEAPGSSDLAYRLGAEVARIGGGNVPASGTLLTNNPMRRQMQSVFADTLFGPGQVSPMTPSGTMSPQGIPSGVWGDASTVERIGLNAMRAAHSVTENRVESGTQAKFLENLQFNRQGEIVAVTPPVHSRGWAQGTVVTEQQLLTRLLDRPGGAPSAAGRDAAGGVGIDTAKMAVMTNTVLAAIEGDRSASVPSWMATKAKQIGRDMGGWAFSEASSEGAGGITREAAEARLTGVVGEKAAKLLLDSGLIGFVDSAADLPGETFSGASGRVQGATSPDGHIVLVTGNLNEETFDGVLIHEALHSTLMGLVGVETFDRMMSRLQTLLNAGKGSNWATEAAARVPANTSDANYIKEVASYAAELYANGEKESNPLVRWAKDFMSAVRSALIKSKLVPESVRTWAINNSQPRDFVRLAVAGLRSQSSSQSTDTKFSEQRDYQGEIDSLLAEHALPDTSNDRRSEINTEIGKLRMAQRVQRDGAFERDSLLSVDQEIAESMAPVAEPSPQELNILNNGARKAFERTIERTRAVFQDRHVTLRRIQQLAGVISENLKLDTIGSLDRLGSRLMAKQAELVKQPLAKIEHILTNAGYSSDDARSSIDQYLTDKHVAEYNAHVAARNPAHYEIKNGVRTHVSGFDAAHPGSGIADEAAAARIASVEAAAQRGGREAALLEANKVYRKMIADLQSYAVEQGLERQETIDAWNEKFPNYTPFNRDLDLEENLSVGTVPGSQGFSLRKGISRAAMGSGADIISPLASTLLFGIKTTTRGENAEVARTFLNFARAFVPNYETRGGMKPMWKVETAPFQRAIKKLNVYQTVMADGSMSPEFYNRAQANDYADYQQTLWVQANPNANPEDSGIGAQQVGDGPQNRVVVQAAPNPMGLDEVMVIPENGENVIITFDKHSRDAMAILEAFKGKSSAGSGAQAMNKLMTIPRLFSRWVMATATGFNPAFGFINLLRDVTGAALSVGSDDIPGWTAADSAAIIKNVPAAAASIWVQRGKEFRALHGNNGAAPAPQAGSYAAWVDEMIKHGGATGIRNSIADIDDAETQIRRLFGQTELTRTTHVSEAVDWLSKANSAFIRVGDSFARFGEGGTKAPIAGWISRNVVSATARLNEAGELATRVAVFKAATEKFIAAGKTEAEAKDLAANISKNVSTNFDRRGSATSTINQLFPFFGAAMQGSARLAESLFEKNTYKVERNGHVMLDQRTKMTPYGKVIVGSLVAIGGLQSALLAMAGYDDDDVPKQIKDRAFIVPLPDGAYLAIPMPHGFNTIINFGREMTDAVIHPEKAGAHIASALWQAPAFNPFGSAGNLVTDFSPAIVDPFASLYMNKDAFGRPIAKENPDPANPTPGFTRAKEGASNFSRNLARALNSISGGNDDQLGAVSPTPDQIDFVLGSIGGGVGREIMKAGAAVRAGVNDLAGNEREAIPTYKMPLIGRLYGETKEPVAIRGKAFSIRQELNELNARYKGLKDRGEVVEANDFYDKHPELALRDDFERFVKKDSKQRKARGLARDADEISTVNGITNAQDSKLAELLARYKEIKPE